MSTIGSNNTTAKKFNIISSSLNIEELDKLSQKSSLIKNAIIVSTSYNGVNDTNLDLFVTDSNGNGAQIMSSEKNALSTMVDHIYDRTVSQIGGITRTKNIPNIPYININKALKFDFNQIKDEEIAKRYISQVPGRKLRYTGDEYYKNIAKCFQTEDGTEDLEDYFCYLWSNIKREFITVTINSIILNTTYVVPVTTNADYITVGFSGGSIEPMYNIYNTFTYSSKSAVSGVVDEFNKDKLFEKTCWININGNTSKNIQINKPGKYTLNYSYLSDSILNLNNITSINYQTDNTQVLSGNTNCIVNGHNADINSNVGSEYNFNNFPVNSDISYYKIISIQLHDSYGNSKNINYNSSASRNDTTPSWKLSEGKLETNGNNNFCYSYYGPIYTSNTTTIDIYHKWINTSGKKISNITITPQISSFYTDRVSNKIQYCLAYKTGNYNISSLNTNQCLDISSYEINHLYYNNDNWNPQTIDIFYNKTQNNKSVSINTDDISGIIINNEGIYNISATCYNDNINTSILPDNSAYFGYFNQYTAITTDATDLCLGFISENESSSIGDGNNVDSIYLLDNYDSIFKNLQFIITNVNIDNGVFVKNQQMQYYYKLTFNQIISSDSTTTPTKPIYQYSITNSSESTDTLRIYIGQQVDIRNYYEYLNKSGSDKPVLTYSYKFNVTDVHGSDITAMCKAGIYNSNNILLEEFELNDGTPHITKDNTIKYCITSDTKYLSSNLIDYTLSKKTSEGINIINQTLLKQSDKNSLILNISNIDIDLKSHNEYKDKTMSLRLKSSSDIHNICDGITSGESASGVVQFIPDDNEYKIELCIENQPISTDFTIETSDDYYKFINYILYINNSSDLSNITGLYSFDMKIILDD